MPDPAPGACARRRFTCRCRGFFVPQFDPASFVSQLFWFGVIFTLLYFAVVRPTLPKVGKVIDAREAQVAGDLDRAEAAKGAADTLRTDHETAMKAARDAAQAAVAQARDAAAKASDARLKALNTSLEADAEAAAASLELALGSARDGLKTTVAELTSEAVAKLAGIAVTPADVSAALAAR
jgi:F-type H+-transporting ATPase subunit b